MKAIRRLVLGLGVALFATAMGLVAAGPAQAATAPASDVQLCRLTTGNVTALDLQENGGDEIFLRLDGQRFPASTLKNVTFTSRGQVRPASAFENPSKVFSGFTTVQLNEKDLLVAQQIDQQRFGCEAQDSVPVQFIGAGAIYTVDVKVEVL